MRVIAIEMSKWAAIPYTIKKAAAMLLPALSVLLIAESAKCIVDLRRDAQNDPLTGLNNRRYFDRKLRQSINKKKHFILLLCDVDDFKRVNDTHGHAAGDAVLRTTASLLKSAFRSTDYICRIGGDEFAVIMTDADESARKAVADKLRYINSRLGSNDTTLPKVSLSAGAACFNGGESAEYIFNEADRALYYVKAHWKGDCGFSTQFS